MITYLPLVKVVNPPSKRIYRAFVFHTVDFSRDGTFEYYPVYDVIIHSEIFSSKIYYQVHMVVPIVAKLSSDVV